MPQYFSTVFDWNVAGWKLHICWNFGKFKRFYTKKEEIHSENKSILKGNMPVMKEFCFYCSVRLGSLIVGTVSLVSKVWCRSHEDRLLWLYVVNESEISFFFQSLVTDVIILLRSVFSSFMEMTIIDHTIIYKWPTIFAFIALLNIKLHSSNVNIFVILQNCYIATKYISESHRVYAIMCTHLYCKFCYDLLTKYINKYKSLVDVVDTTTRLL